MTVSSPVRPDSTIGRNSAGNVRPVNKQGGSAKGLGLTEEQAAGRLRTDGCNELPSARARGLPKLVRDVLSEPMLLILVSTGVVYLILGNVGEALALLVGVFLIIGIEIGQERKTERTLDALRRLSSPRALVIRDGVRRRIPGREVVRGDLVIVSEGDRVPADGILLESDGLLMDESLLTGESAPVRKRSAADEEPVWRPGGDDSPFVFSGTMAVQGRGIVEVQATGPDTEMGKIGKSVSTLATERTPLQIETDRLVRIFAMVGLALCLLVVILYGSTRGSWLNGVLAGLSLAVSMVPEEFPVTLTVFLALGAWRISRAHVLTRRIPAIETLGAATVLCVDKTGTLTQNRMTVRKLWASGVSYQVPGAAADGLPEEFHEVVEFSILASRRDPFDPMEKAFIELGNLFLKETEHLHQDWEFLREYSLTPQLLAMSRVWQPRRKTDGYVVAAKGAPEAVVKLCRLAGADEGKTLSESDSMAAEGLRVLAVAKAALPQGTMPDDQLKIEFEFVGLVGLADPVAPGVVEAIHEAQNAGIRVVMITGDYPATARNIAREIGLQQPDSVISGRQFELIPDDQMRQIARTVNVFARVVPEQKLKLVTAFKQNRQVVAMTGDGVNDAPALKAAHIGIAMGGRGTDVARESAALVLLDDRFPSIVGAVRLGRRIFDNLEKAITFLIAVHIPIAGITLLPLILGWPLILMPLHIVLLELIIDPACSIAFEAEAEEPDVMRRPPRDPHRRLFSRQNVLTGLSEGMVILCTVLAVLWWSVIRGYHEQDVRVITFTSLVLSNIALIFANLSRKGSIFSRWRSPNRSVRWVSGVAMALLTAALFVPALRNLFQFSEPHLDDLSVSLTAALFAILLLEAVKRAAHGFRASSKKPV